MAENGDMGAGMTHKIQSGWEQHEEGIVGSVAPANMLECQWESLQDGCNIRNDVRRRYIGSDESTREEVGCGGNGDVKWMK